MSENIEQGEIQQEEPLHQSNINQKEMTQLRKRDLVQMIRSNPQRYKNLRESLKVFSPIIKNIYLDRKRKRPKNDDLQSCLCRPRGENQDKWIEHTNVSYNCGQKCLNRLISTECDQQTCRCGSLCQNRKFKKHEYSYVYPIPAGGKGWGLAAGQKIYRGAFIMQYIGQVFSVNSQIGRDRLTDYCKSTCTYLMKTSKGQVIDPTKKGNLARFINHSCDPNCITQKWNVNGEICIGIFSLRDIEQDQELTFDYQFDVYSTPLTKCLCGSKRCKGYLGLRPTDITAEQWNQRLEDMTCEICFTNNQDDDLKLIICDECNKGFHIYCLSPPLQQIPEQAFFCKQCQEQKQKLKDQLVRKGQKELLDRKLFKEQQRIEQMEREYEQQDSQQEYPEDYINYFNLLKQEENKAFKELKKMVKKHQITKKKRELTPQKKKTVQIGDPSTPSNKKKDEFFELQKKANDKFQTHLQQNPKILQNINSFSPRRQKIAKAQKKAMLLNKIQMQLILKSNFILFQKIGAQIYVESSNRNCTDFFLKSTQVNVIGSQEQIAMFEDIVRITNEIINELQVEMGITQATVPVPAIFLRRLIGHGHSLISQIQRITHVAIYYHKRFIDQECYPLQVLTKILLKGGKDNIIKAYQQIKRKIDMIEVERIFFNPYEIKTVVNNMPGLKKKAGMAEFRISRDPPFKEVNHPFYYVQQKNKQIAIIGTRAQIQKTRREIMSFFQQPNRKEEFNFNISLFLAQPNHKSQLLTVKNSLQKDVPSIRMMIFDPTPPRKNMTLSFLGTRQNRHKAKDYLYKRLEQLGRQGRIPINLEHFQDQMNYQMTKYYFKYMQNTILTRDTAFMKSWDILNPYFICDQPNYMWKSVSKQLSGDYQTLLYAFFVLKEGIIKKYQEEINSQKTLLQEVYDLVRQNIIRMLNIYNVNNTSALKNYTSQVDYEEAKKLFRETYPYVTFCKPEEKQKEKKPVDYLQDQKQKQRQMSFFQKKIFRKYHNLYVLLEEQRKRDRQRQEEKRKWK